MAWHQNEPNHLVQEKEKSSCCGVVFQCLKEVSLSKKKNIKNVKDI